MKKYLLLLLGLMIFAPVVLTAQHENPDEDPFENDPFFTKPLKDWFSTDEMINRVSDRSKRIIRSGGIDDGYRDISGFSSNPGFSYLDRMHSWVRFNRVDALYLGIQSERYADWGRKNDRALNPYWAVGYSFGRKDWLYTVGIERVFGFNRNFILGATHQRITDSEDQWRVGWTENSLYSFFSVHDFMDYYSRMGTQFYAVYRPDQKVELTIAYSDDDYTSLAKNSDFSVFGDGSNVRENHAIDEGKLQLLKTGFQFNPKDAMLSPGFSLAADLTGEFSDMISSNSDYSYDRVQAELRSIAVLDESAVLRNRLKLVSVTGNAPDFKHIPLGGISTMRATPFKSMMGSHSVLFNTELMFGFEAGKIYMEDVLDIDLKSFKFSFFADMGWTNGVSGNGLKLMDGFEDFSLKDFKTDVGFGVNLSAMRFEAAWNSNDLTTTPVIWLRFNPTF
ncbi:MAG TPA: hypothetical protein DCE78_03180 [Bacteroidetes bacterium]|nr:hypothetical protein [Bacteroidota bacterium]